MKNKDFKKDYEDLLNSKVDTLKCFSWGNHNSDHLMESNPSK